MSSKIKSDRFSLKLYKKTLIKAKKLGYKFPFLSAYKKWINQYSSFILLRHDIDISPLNALQMAELESSLGITSTYYVRMHSAFYNPSASPFLDILRKIKKAGHEIGLHYDCGFYKKKKIPISKGISIDAGFLGHLIGAEVKSISQHKPVMRGWANKIPSRYINAYNEELMSKMTYISESGFKWRGKPLYDFIGSHPRIYALIHPDTWAHSNLDMPASYNRTSKMLQQVLKSACSTFIDSTYVYLKHRQRKDKVT